MGTEISPNRVAEFNLTQAAAPRANADPLPGALADAFTIAPIMVEGTEVRKMVPGDWMIFKAIKSPMDRIQLGDSPDEIKPTDEENVELIFQFITPIQKLREILRKGRDIFREEALKAVTDQMEPEKIAKLGEAVAEQFRRYYAIRLRHIQDSQSEGKETVTNFPAQPALPKQG